MTLSPLAFEDLALSEIYHEGGYVIFMRKDHIVQVKFDKGFHGELEDAKKMVEIFKKLGGNKKCLVLAIYEPDNTFSKEAREYVASDEVSRVVAADAFVIKGLALKIIGNGYLRINKPRRPARLFNTAASAVKWLKQFQEKL